MSEKKTYIAKTLYGLEEVLAQELKTIGVEDIQQGARAVTFKADTKQMYKVNLWSHTALRVLMPIKTFDCPDEETLYLEVMKIDWSQYMTVNDSLAVDAVLVESNLSHSKYAALKTKDAIVDRFRNKYGSRPDVDVLRPTIRVHTHISRNVCTVSIDTSGESLHKRGYREAGNEAPLNECMAAGLILLSGWDKQSNFVDITCGSGTILIEAALMATHTPPGIFRQEYGFERWLDFDKQAWQELLDEANAGILPDIDFDIAGCDVSRNSFLIAQQNITNAGFVDLIDVYKMSFQQMIAPAGGGTLICNPPYGERIAPEDINALYREMGDRFKQAYAGYTAWVFSHNKGAVKSVGLRPSKKVILFNGPLECRFLRYDMYTGTRDERKLKNANNHDD